MFERTDGGTTADHARASRLAPADPDRGGTPSCLPRAVVEFSCSYLEIKLKPPCGAIASGCLRARGSPHGERNPESGFSHPCLTPVSPLSHPCLTPHLTLVSPLSHPCWRGCLRGCIPLWSERRAASGRRRPAGGGRPTDADAGIKPATQVATARRTRASGGGLCVIARGTKEQKPPFSVFLLPVCHGAF